MFLAAVAMGEGDFAEGPGAAAGCGVGSWTVDHGHDDGAGADGA